MSLSELVSVCVCEREREREREREWGGGQRLTERKRIFRKCMSIYSYFNKYLSIYR